MNELDDENAFHDVLVEVFLTLGIRERESLTSDRLKNLYNSLPKHIRSDAEIWGAGDSVFRDNAYVWFVENWNK